MAFKFTCAVVLLSVVFLSAQAKHQKKEGKKGDKYYDEVVPVHFDKIEYKGERVCTDYNRKTSTNQWCTCPFTLCTGAQQCYQYYLGEDIRCTVADDITKDDYKNDLSDKCSCRYDKK